MFFYFFGCLCENAKVCRNLIFFLVVSVVIGSGFHLLAVVYYMIGGFGLMGFLMCNKLVDDLFLF